MHVEECCQALLAQILPRADQRRHGVCIDVGVGTFAFYCELFAGLGFRTAAVEPLPVSALRRVCSHNGITLMECCLSDVDGYQTLYVGTYEGAENVNLSSLLPEWWGASSKALRVPSMTLSTMLSAIDANRVTCLKLDVEGAERTIIRQLPSLPESLLPSVLVFEYGGGDTRESGRAGWSQRFLADTMECLDVLKRCGYGFSVVIDSAPATTERIFDLQRFSSSADRIFHPLAVYGNIISTRGFAFAHTEVTATCAAYCDDESPANG